MIRIFAFEFEGGVKINVASLTAAQAEKHIDRGSELLKDKEKTTADEWITYSRDTIAQSLNLAAGDSFWSPKKVGEEFDLPTINAMLSFIREKSGLKSAGEAAAT